MKRLILNGINSLGRSILRKFKPTVVLVTGSVGKTTTKDAIYTALRGQIPTLRTIGSQNAQWGVFLSLVGYNKRSDAYTRLGALELLGAIAKGIKLRIGSQYPRMVVIEIGADHPGDIAYLTRYYRPDVAVLTNIGPSHLANFASLDEIAKEKAELLWSLPETGVAVLNRDDPKVRELGERLPNKVIWYGTSEGSEVRALEVEVKPERLRYRLEIGEKQYRVELPVRGGAGLFASLAAIGVVQALRLDLERSLGALRGFESGQGRLKVIEAGGIRVVDDTYNAAPASMRVAIEYLASFPGRRVAILGEMRELGALSEEAHLEVGRLASEAAERVIVVGEEASGIARGAGKAASRYSSAEDLINSLPRELKAGDTVLVKASRGVYLERVVDAIQEMSGGARIKHKSK